MNDKHQITRCKYLNLMKELRLKIKDPNLYIRNYFKHLRNKVYNLNNENPINRTELIKARIKPLENDSDDNLKKQDLIKKIDEIENYCYNNMPANEKLLENIKSIQLIEDEIKSLNLNENETIEEIENKIIRLDFKVKKLLFSNKIITLEKNNQNKFFLLIKNDDSMIKYSNNKIKSFKSCKITNELIKEIILNQTISETVDYFKELNFDNIQECDLSGNKINSIEINSFKDFSNLTKLDLRCNNFTQIHSNSFNELNLLKKLILSSNEINYIEIDSFKCLSNLVKLDLRRNNLTEINFKIFQELINLKDINLSSNRISSIEDLSFQNLNNLISLNLNDNIITSINTNTFKGLINLTDLYLSDNKINTIEEYSFNCLFNLERLKMPLTDSTNNYFSQIIDLNQKQPKIKYGILK